MKAYYSDGRGRYNTGESYDWFWKYEDDDSVEIHTSSDELWTYTIIDKGIEVLRYNGSNTDIMIPSVIDGKNVVSLDSTFDGFYELKRAVIPDGITSIEGAFYGCEGLEHVVLPESIVDMTYAFNSCNSLRNLEIPSGVQNFSWAFQGTSLESITFPQGTKNISRAFLASEYLKEAFLPKSVVNSKEAFSDCEALTKVVIEDGVKSIDDWAFYNCISLSELTIPESVVKFGEKSVGFMEIREYTSPRRSGYRSKGDRIIPGFKIKGISGSAAEKYAEKNGIEFAALW